MPFQGKPQPESRATRDQDAPARPRGRLTETIQHKDQEVRKRDAEKGRESTFSQLDDPDTTAEMGQLRL